MFYAFQGFIISNIAKHLKVKAAFSQSALGKINNIINETLDGIRVIKLFTRHIYPSINGNHKTRFIDRNLELVRIYSSSNFQSL